MLRFVYSVYLLIFTNPTKSDREFTYTEVFAAILLIASAFLLFCLLLA
ncbi:hypothetical protein [Nibrella saemangeumensis]